MAAQARALRYGLWALAALVAIVIALVAADPYIPEQVSFSTADENAIREYQRIVTSHGYRFHFDAAASGERRVVIDRITGKKYKAIHCEFERWQLGRNRTPGVLEAPSPECAL
jgi:hypothetical protein